MTCLSVLSGSPFYRWLKFVRGWTRLTSAAFTLLIVGAPVHAQKDDRIWVGLQHPVRDRVLLEMERQVPRVLEYERSTVAWLRHLSPEEFKPYLSRNGNNLLGTDAFQRDDTRKRVISELLPVLQSRAPKLPIKLRAHHLMSIDRYDFDRQGFVFPVPATGQAMGGYGAAPSGAPNVRKSIVGCPLPEFVPMAPDAARSLLERARNRHKTLPAHYSGLTGFDLEVLMADLTAALQRRRIGELASFSKQNFGAQGEDPVSWALKNSIPGSKEGVLNFDELVYQNLAKFDVAFRSRLGIQNVGKPMLFLVQDVSITEITAEDPDGYGANERSTPVMTMAHRCDRAYFSLSPDNDFLEVELYP